MSHPDPAAMNGGGRRAATRAVIIALVVGGIGLLLCALGLIVDARQTYFSWLTAFAAGLALAVGALSLVMIEATMAAKWFIVLRRLADAMIATLPLLALLFIPVLAGLPHLYPWVPPLHALAPKVEESIRAKQGYLNVPFFVIRAVVYFAIWIAVTWFLRHWSLRQDESGGSVYSRRQRALGAGATPFVALAITFAAFDWVMSLAPEWWSTVFGVYVWSGGFVGAMALLGSAAWFGVRSGLLEGFISPDHFHALGKLTLTFVIFWAYIAFSQYIIIWIADIPAEASWYVVRSRGSWGVLGLVLLIGHFAIPFLILLSRPLKRRPAVMGVLGLWLVSMHYLDIYWMVMPELHPDAVHASWTDLAALAAVGGLTTAYALVQFRAHPAVPRGDPQLELSMAYRSDS